MTSVKQKFEVRNGRRFRDPVEQVTFHFRLRPRFVGFGSLAALAEAEGSSTKALRSQLTGRRIGDAAFAQNIVSRFRAYAAAPRSSGSVRDLIGAAHDLLVLDPCNLDAATTLVDLFKEEGAASLAVAAAASLVRCESQSAYVIRSEAHDLLWESLVQLLDVDDVGLFVQALPVLLSERPASTLARCSLLLHSGDSDLVADVADSLEQNEGHCVERELQDAVRRKWLKDEKDLRLLLAHGRHPLVPPERIPRILEDGLAHASPVARILAARRCAVELESGIARRLLDTAKTDEPDDVVLEHIDAALSMLLGESDTLPSDE